VLLSAVLLVGCAGLWPQPYGQVAEDADPVRAGGLPTYIPPNAPSTLNGYWADYEGHVGIDVLGPVGMPVLAPAPGIVQESRFEPMYGHQVVIDHGRMADGVAVRSVLVHLDERLVTVGQQVARGEQVATLGRTGMLAGGIPHLHFELRTRQPRRFTIFEPKNPNLYWADGAGVITCFDRNRAFDDSRFVTTYPAPCRGVPWRDTD
jgi:murein DD-endopeptidase MepM/ murein hydrolase activator NlpD